MRTRAAILAALTAGLLLTGCGKSYDQSVKDCRAALSVEHTVTNRPAACNDLTEEDYKLVLAHYVTEQAGGFDLFSPSPDADEPLWDE
ncbi:hypothetical protein ACWIFI_18750 [Streptomyces albidoflavus]